MLTRDLFAVAKLLVEFLLLTRQNEGGVLCYPCSRSRGLLTGKFNFKVC